MLVTTLLKLAGIVFDTDVNKCNDSYSESLVSSGNNIYDLVNSKRQSIEHPAV